MPQKRTILITGCSDGSLGSALALSFHKAGWRVLASARNMSKLKNVEEAGIETVQLDTVSDESISTCVSRAKELTGGSLDALLNNAGAGYSMPLMDLDIDKARSLFDLNVWSLISVTRAFLPLLMNSTFGGMVINNTSCSSLLVGALPFGGAYNASKAAATSLTENMRLELAPFGIKVINLLTGVTRSTFFDNAPKGTLPPDSLYNIAKERVERGMSGVDMDGGDAAEYADGIVRQVSGRSPSHWVFQGKSSTLARIGNFLPIGFADRMAKEMTGLDVVEQKVKEQGGPSKLKLS